MSEPPSSNEQLTILHPQEKVSENPPTTPLCIKIGFSRSHSLSPALKTLHDQVFNALPQNPHFGPLASEYSSIQEGLKLGYDVIFLNLVQKIRGLVDPIDLLNNLDEFIAQFSQLEKMGYDVKKLRDRFDVMRKYAEQVKDSRDKMEVLEGEMKDKRVKVELYESRISEKKAELKKVEAGLKAQKYEFENLQSRSTKVKEDSRKNLSDFASVAREVW